MFLNHGFFDDGPRYGYGYDHGDDYDPFSPFSTSRHQQNRRRAAMEAARRRAAEEEYYARMQQAEEEERRRRYYERLRRQHRQEEEEEERRLQQQQEEEQERRRQELELKRLRLAQESEEEDDDDDEEDEHVRYGLVRGMDGRIYRVPLYQNQGRRRSGKNKTGGPGARGRTSSLEDEGHREVLSENKQNIPITSKKKIVVGPSITEHNEEEDKIHNVQKEKTRNNDLPKRKKSKKRIVTFIVEDASDSEQEDEVTKSVWRNRRPSPGQWIEPVEEGIF